MKFSDVKLLLPSSGFMKTSQANGRAVIDEMRDASYERNHQTFVGDDRPELYQDLQGRFFTSVEKESTNQVLYSNNFDPSVTNYINGDVVLENTTTSVFKNKNGFIFRGDNGTNDYLRTPIGQYVSGEIKTLWAIIEQGTSDIFDLVLRVSGDGTERATYTFSTDSVVKGGNTNGLINTEVDRIILSESGPNGGRVVLLVFSYEAEASIDGIERRCQIYPTGITVANTTNTIFHHLQLDDGRYPTNPIFTEGTPVTRLAPSSVIENALPETGTIAFVVDRIVGDLSSAEQRPVILGTGASTSTSESMIRFDTNNIGDLTIIVFGTTGGFINSFNANLGLSAFQRIHQSIIVTWDNETLNAYIMQGSNIYKTSVSHNLNDTSLRNCFLGRRNNVNELSENRGTSIRFETQWYKDSIVRVNATDDEIKAFFETLVKGTSMEMKAEDMVIV